MSSIILSRVCDSTLNSPREIYFPTFLCWHINTDWKWKVKIVGMRHTCLWQGGTLQLEQKICTLMIITVLEIFKIQDYTINDVFWKIFNKQKTFWQLVNGVETSNKIGGSTYNFWLKVCFAFYFIEISLNYFSLFGNSRFKKTWFGNFLFSYYLIFCHMKITKPRLLIDLELWLSTKCRKMK